MASEFSVIDTMEDTPPDISVEDLDAEERPERPAKSPDEVKRILNETRARREKPRLAFFEEHNIDPGNFIVGTAIGISSAVILTSIISYLL